jgi:hypothetical protein
MRWRFDSRGPVRRPLENAPRERGAEPAEQIYVFRRGRYSLRAKSDVLPKLDLALFARCLRQPDQAQAVRALRRELRKS